MENAAREEFTDNESDGATTPLTPVPIMPPGTPATTTPETPLDPEKDEKIIIDFRNTCKNNITKPEYLLNTFI